MFSFSKAYGMAGNRTGYLVGPAAAIAQAQKISTHTFYAAPTSGQVAGLRALRDGAAWIARARASYEEVGRRAAERLGVGAPEGSTFLFLDVSARLDARGIWGFLEDCVDDGVALAPGPSCGARLSELGAALLHGGAAGSGARGGRSPRGAAALTLGRAETRRASPRSRALQRRSIDAFDVPSQPAISVAARPWTSATSACAMSVSSPASTPASMQRRTLPDDELAHRAAGLAVRRARVEVGEAAQEHQLGQHRVRADERAERLEHAHEIGARIAGLGELVEAPPQHAEALEEDLAHEPGLVAEQLVDRGRRGLAPARRPGAS